MKGAQWLTDERAYPESFEYIPARLREWLAEMLGRSAFLGWAAEHFEGYSRN